MELLTVSLFLYTGNAVILPFGILLLLIPIISIPVNLYLRKKLQVSVEAVGSLHKGDSGNITVIFENRAVFPVLRLSFEVLAVNQLNGMESRQRFMTYVRSGKRQNINMQLHGDYCGRIRISTEKIKIFDCFGLVGFKVKNEAVAHMTVQADTFDQNISIIPNPNGADDSDLYSQEKAGNDMSETFQIREYVQGDSPRQIHWKLSNKFDRLIVKDPSMPIVRSVLVFWERTGESGDPELIDAQAEAVISLCRNLQEQSVQFTIGWNDTDRNLCILKEIQNLDELVGFMPRILRATGAKAGVSGAHLLSANLMKIPAHIVYIAEQPQNEITELYNHSRVTVLACGGYDSDNAVIFDAKNYIQQLSQLEI